MEINKNHRIITQTLIIELNEKEPDYDKCRLWLLVDKLIENAIVDGNDDASAIKYISYC